MRVRLIKMYCAKYIDKGYQSHSCPFLPVITWFTTKLNFLKLKLLTCMDPDLFMEGGDLYEFIHLLCKFMKFEFHRNGSDPAPSQSPTPS